MGYGLVPVSFFAIIFVDIFSWERKGFSLKRKNALALVSKRILKSLPRPAIFRSLQNSVRAVAMPRITMDAKEIFMVLPTFSSSCFFVLASLDGRRTNGFFANKDQNHPILLE